MVSGQNLNPVQSCLRDLMALEGQLETVVDRLVPAVAIHPQVADAFGRYQRTVRAHRAAFDARADVIARQMPVPATIVAIPTTPATFPPEHVVSQALHTLYTALNHAAFGYSMLHVIAHRAFDSQEPDNTADLAEAHLRDYAAAVQELNQLVSEVVVWELSQLGHECQCKCPACGLGMCMCSPHGTTTLNEVWGETRPSAPVGGLWVRQPWSASAAAQAGLRVGDRIVAVDEQTIASDWDIPTLQNGIRDHQPGEAIRLRVQRVAGELEDMTLTRP
jgi:membrane-associated protease RseP (regulator of RpoE activity)